MTFVASAEQRCSQMGRLYLVPLLAIGSKCISPSLSLTSQGFIPVFEIAPPQSGSEALSWRIVLAPPFLAGNRWVFLGGYGPELP